MLRSVPTAPRELMSSGWLVLVSESSGWILLPEIFSSEPEAPLLSRSEHVSSLFWLRRGSSVSETYEDILSCNLDWV